MKRITPLTRRKVLFVNVTADLYGASQILLRLLDRLPKAAYEPVVVLPYEGPLCGELERRGIAYHVLPLSILRRQSFKGIGVVRLLGSLVPNALRLAAFIRAHRVDLVHTFSTVVLTGALAAWLTRRPHLWHLHELLSTESSKGWAVFRRLIVRLSSHVACVSKAVADQFAGADKVAVVYNGIAPEDFEVDAPQRAAGTAGLRIGVVGRISPRKGQEVLLHALALLKCRPGMEKVQLSIIGDVFPGYEAHLQRLKRQVADLHIEENVVFTGFQQNVGAVYAAMDIVVVPSLLPEGFGMVALEAMAAGRPVVVSAVAGLTEVVDANSGVVVPPGDAVALSEALYRLAADADARTRLGAAGRQRARLHFDHRRMASSVVKLYDACGSSSAGEEETRPPGGKDFDRQPLHAAA